MSFLLDLGVPALIGTALLATLPLIEPSIRWSRRLKNDIQISAGLPDGPERKLWNAGIENLARDLREYREAFSAVRVLLRYAVFTYGLAGVGYLLWPTGWNEWMEVNGVPGIPLALIVGLTAYEFFIVVAYGVGFGFQRAAVILRDRRNKPHYKRLGKLLRLDRKRRRAIKTGRKLHPKGSRLGFEAWLSSKDVLRP